MKKPKQIYQSPENEPTPKKNIKPLEKVISFRVSEQMYNILVQKSLEQNLGVKPHYYCKKIIEKTTEITEVKTLFRVYENTLNKLEKLENLVRILMASNEISIVSHYASHPEPPSDPKEREKLSLSAEKRSSNHWKLALSKKALVFEKVLADQLEETE